MNNKGFAATSILYTVLVLFIIVMLGMITLLYGRNSLLNKIRSEVKGQINTVFNYDVYENGTAVYFNPETSTICSPANAVSTTGTKTGCMKWYVFNDSSTNDFVYMILDHNTTATVAYAGVQDELIKLESESNWKVEPRLITATEVAMISGHPTFDVSTSTDWFYFGSNNQTNTTLRGNYSWLYDYTNCTGYGCNMSDTNNNGYWTANNVAGRSASAWSIGRIGVLHFYAISTADVNGIRPVIQVNKRLISANSTNLVSNGDLALKNNTNFSSFTYEEDVEGGYLRYTGDSRLEMTNASSEGITIDSNASYTLSIDLKDDTDAKHYVGLTEYDADGRIIYAQMVSYIEGSLTSLKQDLKPGDTVVYLDDVSRFKTSTSTPSYQLGFIFWNYSNSSGYMYPAETYSRYVYFDLYNISGVDVTNNTITLKTAWTGATIPSGTKLSQSSSGSVYNYSILNGATFLNNEWNNYTANISGINNTGGVNPLKFRHGTEYVRLFVWFDYNNQIDTTLYMKNIKLIKNS